MMRRHLTGLVRVSIGLLSLAIIAGLLTAATGPFAAASANHVRSALLSASQCGKNRSVGVITYVSPFGFDASAGILDVFAAAKLGYFADMCLDVRIVTNATDNNEL